MVTFALRAVREKVEARLAADAELAGSAEPKASVRALLVQMLPIDEQHWLEGHVGLAFHAYAAIQPGLAEQLRTDSAQLRAVIGEQIHSVRGSSADDAGADALIVIALVEGLSMQALNHYYDAATTLAALDAQLDATFGEL